MIRIFLTVFLLNILPAVAAPDPEPIANPAEPPVVETWHLREVWRLDNDADPELPLMGVIARGEVDAAGHVLLLDSQLSHVLEIAPSGEYLRTLGRAGEGPGEMRQPSNLFLADGGQVGLLQVYPGRIVFLGRDGTPQGDFELQGANPHILRAMEAAGHLVLWEQYLAFGEDALNGERTSRLRGTSRAGEAGHVFLEASAPMNYDPPLSDETRGWFPGQAWTLAPDGSLLVAPVREAYRLEWREADGTLRRAITRDFAPHQRTREDRRRVEGSMRKWVNGREVEQRKIIFDTEAAVQSLQVLRDGTLWVRSCYAERGLPDGVHCRYDVFDAAGRLQREVRIAFPVDRDRDYFSLLADGRFLWFRNVRSAQRAQFAAVEGDADAAPGAEDLVLQVVLLERER